MIQCIGISVILYLLRSNSLALAENSKMDQLIEYEELTVIAAAVEQLHLDGLSRWIIVADHTSSLSCDSGQITGFAMAQCNGMRPLQRDPEKLMEWVRENIRPVTTQLTDRLISVSATNTPITAPLPLSIRQVIWGPTGHQSIPEGLGSPDLAVYPSRVAFDDDMRVALVYVGAINWRDASKSLGGYVYLERIEDSWTVKNHVVVWRTGG